MQTERRHATAGGGLLWGAAFTLGPYVLAVLVLLALSWSHDRLPPGQCEGLGWGCSLPPRDGALLLTFISAPFAALATGLAWLLVLLLQLSPAKRWAGAAQGALAAAVVLAVVVGVLFCQSL
ncbi:hypothetical protein [Actinopolymorpha alba]|uniref:hypothetical protein n=1 Tax=Actinopolymorpha alba TaxID=533267 RepID=UPI00035CFE99|nr:hypothetical protein [Actinopolymorpha alba]